MKKILAITTVLLASLLFLLISTEIITFVKPTDKIALGFWTTNLWDDEKKVANPESLEKLEIDIEKKSAVAHIFVGWEDLAKPEFINELEKLSAKDWVVMVSTNPYFGENCKTIDKTLYEAISSGECDELIDKISVNLESFKSKFLLRFAWEMNVDTIEWSAYRTGSSQSEFVDAWKRFYTRVKARNKNVFFVFSPQVNSSGTHPFTQFYPGDEYVDWVGLDGYNWGSSQEWSNWSEFKQIFHSSYKELNQIAPTKRLMIAEVNSTFRGGDRALWYKKMLNSQLSSDFPQLELIVFFDEDKTIKEGVDWSLRTDNESFKAFIDSIKNPIFSSTLQL